MNFRITPVALALLLVGSSVSAQSASSAKPFEGTITCSMASPVLDDQKHDMIINCKNGKSEIEIDAGMQGRIRMFEDPAANKRYVVMDAMKMGMTVDIKEEAQIDSNGGDIVALVASGKKETFNGHQAEEWIGNLEENGTMHFWLASDFAPNVREIFLNSLKISSTGGKQVRNLFEQVRRKNAVPVRVSLEMNGKEQLEINLLRVEPHTVDDKLFKIPTDIEFEDAPH